MTQEEWERMLIRSTQTVSQPPSMWTTEFNVGKYRGSQYYNFALSDERSLLLALEGKK